jgi:hypothetical protein
MRLLAALSIAGTFALVSTAEAQPSAPTPAMEDARCLLAMVALSNSSDQRQQRLGQNGAVFFAARLKAHDPSFAFSRLKSIATTMNAQTAQTDLQQRCGPMFNNTMQELETALAPPASATPRSATPPPPPSAPHRP